MRKQLFVDEVHRCKIVGIEGHAMACNIRIGQGTHETQIMAVQNDLSAQLRVTNQYTRSGFERCKVIITQQHQTPCSTQSQFLQQEVMGGVARDHQRMIRLRKLMFSARIETTIDDQHLNIRVQPSQDSQIAGRQLTRPDHDHMILQMMETPARGRQCSKHRLDDCRCGQKRGAKIRDPQQRLTPDRSTGWRANVQAANHEQTETEISLGQQS